jgi:hypothetical protein
VKFKSGLQASQPFCCNYDEGVLAASSFVFVFSTGSAVHSWGTSFHCNSSTISTIELLSTRLSKVAAQTLEWMQFERKGTR